MNAQTALHDIFQQNQELLNFIDHLNRKNVTNAITGSSSLYIHGGFGRKPNDLDLYTSETELKTLSTELKRTIVTKSFPPVSWIELEEIANGPHILAKLECNFDNGSYYDFSMTDLLIQNLKNYDLDGITVRVVPPEEVLLLKLTAPRKSDTKDDIADVKNYLKENQLDNVYFEKRGKEIGTYEIVIKRLRHE